MVGRTGDASPMPPRWLRPWDRECLRRQTNMASSDSDDDVIASSLFLLTSIVHEKHKLNENGRRFIRYCASAH